MTARTAASALSASLGGKVPPSTCTAYKIAALIYKHGPTAEFDVFRSVTCNPRASVRRKIIIDYVDSGWLIRRGSKIDITRFATEYFDGLQKMESQSEKPMGQIATPREMFSAFARPPISKRFIPNSQGFRADVPEFSVRHGQSFLTKA